jgi:hypothetical protein
MKTKVAIFLLSAVVLVSITALSSNRKSPSQEVQPKSYQSSDGNLMSDKDQFN